MTPTEISPGLVVNVSTPELKLSDFKLIAFDMDSTLINIGLLTGKTVDQPWGDICDGAEKKKMLIETCAQLGINPLQAIAVGDGANDLPMMGVAGLSVAYHAKPKVREQAMVAINEGGLDRLLELLN